MPQMPRPTVDFDTVRKIALAFPGAEEATSWGVPAFKIGGEMFACTPANKSAEAGSLVVLVDFARREELLVEAPETYYITPHYAGYPSVLVRLARIQPDALRGLLAGAIQFVQSRRKRPSKRRRGVE